MSYIRRFSLWARVFFALSVSSSTGCGPDLLADPPGAGHLAGRCDLPLPRYVAPAPPVDTFVGDGTPASCSSAAFVQAVARGGSIGFRCGPDPVVISLEQTAQYLDAGSAPVPWLLLDGENKVTLSGAGRYQILRMMGCDPRLYPPTVCKSRELTVWLRNLTFIDGISQEPSDYSGGAIYTEIDYLNIDNCRFYRNRGYIRIGSRFGGAVSGGGVITVSDSTFGGHPSLGNSASMGGAIGMKGILNLRNSVISYNSAIEPVEAGFGGGIYVDQQNRLTICGCELIQNITNGVGAAFHGNVEVLTLRNTQVLDNLDRDRQSQYKGIYLPYGSVKLENSIVR